MSMLIDDLFQSRWALCKISKVISMHSEMPLEIWCESLDDFGLGFMVFLVTSILRKDESLHSNNYLNNSES